MRPALRTTTLAIALAFGACRSPAPVSLDPDFVLGVGLDEGFAPVAARRTWHTEDSAILRIDLEDGEEGSTRYVRIRVFPPASSAESEGPESAPDVVLMSTTTVDLTFTRSDGATKAEQIHSVVLPYDVEVFDADGTFAEASRASVPEAFLSWGLYRVCELMERAYGDGPDGVAPELSDAERREFGKGFLSLVSLMQIVQGNEALAPFLWKVIERPSLWSILRNRGTVSLAVQGLDERPAEEVFSFPAPVGELRGYSLPFVLALNGKPALDVRLGVVESYPPFLISGGIVSLEGRSLRHPERCIRMTLAASRIGSGTGLSFDLDGPLEASGRP